MKLEDMKRDVLLIIDWFPKSNGWKPYLSTIDWKKVYFNIFITKYWIDWNKCNYKDGDLKRRFRIVEFFDNFLKICNITSNIWKRIILETSFHRMVIIEIWGKWKERWEVLSFYHK